MNAQSSNFSPSTGKRVAPPIALDLPHHKTAVPGAAAVPIYVAYERRDHVLLTAWRIMKHREPDQPHPLIGLIIMAGMLALLALAVIAFDPADASALEVAFHAND